jgi:hypothetical protein
MRSRRYGSISLADAAIVRAVLSQTNSQLDMSKWPVPVIRLLLDQMTPAAVLAAADDPDLTKEEGLRLRIDQRSRCQRGALPNVAFAPHERSLKLNCLHNLRSLLELRNLP